MQLDHKIVLQIEAIIADAQAKAIRSVDFERVIMYWQIGNVIFEEEQQGKERADYGKFLIKSIAARFQPTMGSGFSVRQLYRYVQFYRLFQNMSTLRTQFSWTHYKLLLSTDNPQKREFYIAETTKNNWSARQLERQINSQLFERLLQMYVNYYDRYEKQDYENPSIGILLCADKNDTMVKISLPENNNTIVASKYQLYLPKEADLKDEINRIVGKCK